MADIQRKEKILKVLKQNIKLIQTPRKKPKRSIVDETFAALSIKNHKLIEQIIEQVKYGE